MAKKRITVEESYFDGQIDGQPNFDHQFDHKSTISLTIKVAWQELRERDDFERAGDGQVCVRERQCVCE